MTEHMLKNVDHNCMNLIAQNLSSRDVAALRKTSKIMSKLIAPPKVDCEVYQDILSKVMKECIIVDEKVTNHAFECEKCRFIAGNGMITWFTAISNDDPIPDSILRLLQPWFPVAVSYWDIFDVEGGCYIAQTPETGIIMTDILLSDIYKRDVKDLYFTIDEFGSVWIEAKEGLGPLARWSGKTGIGSIQVGYSTTGYFSSMRLSEKTFTDYSEWIEACIDAGLMNK